MAITMSVDAPPAGEVSHDERGMRFNLHELAGALGDLGTFLPLTVAMAAATGLNLGWMLVAAGLMNIASGLVFRIPIPVQPMKAIAAVAIADGLSGGAVVAAGWTMGILLTLLAVTGLMPWIDRKVPRPVVRAIQLGVGLKLCLTALGSVGGLPWFGMDGVALTIVVSIALMVGVLRRWPMVLVVFVAGFVVLAVKDRALYGGLGLAWPTLEWIVPSRSEWVDGWVQGALPQLPLTLLNSVIAVCALSGDYFPKRAIAPKRMAASVGLMNLLCIGWSGMPMCHGAGGLAAQVRAGARTGGSVVMLGVGKCVVGLGFGVSLMPLLNAYPVAVLAPLVAFAGISLAQAGCKATHRRDWLVVLPAAVVMAWTQTLYGFAVAVVIYLLLSIFVRSSRAERNP